MQQDISNIGLRSQRKLVEVSSSAICLDGDTNIRLRRRLNNGCLSFDIRSMRILHFPTLSNSGCLVVTSWLASSHFRSCCTFSDTTSSWDNHNTSSFHFRTVESRDLSSWRLVDMREANVIIQSNVLILNNLKSVNG